MKYCLIVLCITFHIARFEAQYVPGHAKALVIGISHYQDPEIPDMQLPHRDAELFASFLRSNQSNLIDDENLLLITNAEATSARIASALDWLFEYTTSEDTVILYFAGYGMEPNQTSIPPSKLYFFDTPYNLSNAGSFDLFLQFRAYVEKRNPIFKLFGNVYPLLLPPELRDDSLSIPVTKKMKETFKNIVYLNTINPQTYTKTFEEISSAKISLNHFLLDGMLGLADKNKDQFVTLKEMGDYLNHQTVIPETWPGLLFAAGSSYKQKLTTVDVDVLKNLKELKNPIFSSIVNLETDSRQDILLRKLSEKNRLLYQDFIVAIKLGHLLIPEDRNASSLADSLLQQKELAPIYGDIRRKLSAALQDEVQQALNAYLNADSREITKRRNGNNQYNLYPLYLKRASELLGEHHYMANILTAKRLYFEGLNKRMEAQLVKNKEAIREALALQLQALSFEKEASFIYNEIAINYSILKNKVAAKNNFQAAIEFSPSWSIPFSNFAQLYLNDDLAKALRIAKHAIRLSPRNSFAYNIEGSIYLQSKDYPKAEVSFLKALKLDPGYAVVFYNLACLYSLQGDFVSAKNNFESAIQNGFTDIEQAMNDPDLEAFRNQIQWKELLVKYFSEKNK